MKAALLAVALAFFCAPAWAEERILDFFSDVHAYTATNGSRVKERDQFWLGLPH